MKIVHIIQTMDPLSGGPPVVAGRLAEAQARLGHEVSILAGDNGGAVRTSMGSGHPAIIPARISPGVRAFFDRSLREVLTSTISPGTLLHLHGVWEPLLWVAAATAKKRGIPYVVAPHGMLDRWSLENRRWKKRLALALGYRRMLDRAAFLHALNANEKARIERLGIKSRAEVIPNGVDLADFPEAWDEGGAEPPVGGRPYILFLGRLHRKKGLDYLAEAYARMAGRCPEVDLVVAGPDYGEKARFERRIAACGLSNRVHLVGPTQGARKQELLRGALCFCLPSRSEGFSVAVLEAMAAGIPVVISKECHFPEAGAAGAGLVVDLDAGKLASALLALIKDKPRAAAMGQAGQRLAAAEYTWSKIAEKSLEKYRGAML
jgi:glycosyltransferase involved in cell wall biosynthesis